MKAAILTALNSPLTVADVDLAFPLQFGQVLVRVKASGICGAQLQEIRGEKGNAKLIPHLLGHEGAGVVEEVGPAVTRVKKGDLVVMHWRKAAGIESPFPSYVYEGREITSGKVTTLAEFTICSENRLTPVPIDTPVELCALLGCGLSTALGTIERDAAVRFGESVMIVGAGGLGMNLVIAAKLAQASQITVLDVVETKRAMVEARGARFYPSCAAHLAGKHDVVINTAGTPESITSTFGNLAPSGRYILVGQAKPGESVTINHARNFFDGDGQTMRATQGGGFRPEIDVPRYVNLWRAGLLDISSIISHRYKLTQINEAIAAVRVGEASRVLVEMS